MGSSKRNRNSRANSIIKDNYKTGIIGKSGIGLGGLVKELMKYKLNNKIYKQMYTKLGSPGLRISMVYIISALRKYNSGIYSEQEKNLQKEEFINLISEQVNLETESDRVIFRSVFYDFYERKQKSIDIFLFIKTFITKILNTIFKRNTLEDLSDVIEDDLDEESVGEQIKHSFDDIIEEKLDLSNIDFNIECQNEEAYIENLRKEIDKILDQYMKVLKEIF
ncbi:MAG: hypothetical protein PHC62_03035 [Candidatus Izemoplasmatales bacterium]|nr:hypothetical protein [Candidatus Izemoplasmatales bacterium]